VFFKFSSKSRRRRNTRLNSNVWRTSMLVNWKRPGEMPKQQKENSSNCRMKNVIYLHIQSTDYIACRLHESSYNRANL